LAGLLGPSQSELLPEISAFAYPTETRTTPDRIIAYVRERR